MLWTGGSVVRRDLTVLVTDVRNSTELLTECSPREVLLFLQEFSSLTAEILNDVCGGGVHVYRIDNFVGDGFLALLDEVDLNQDIRLGPARALVAARRMRSEFRRMCGTRFGNFTAGPQQVLPRLGLVCGITHGQVLYGPVAAPAVSRATAMGEAVVKAFRFSTVRNRPELTDPDCVLLCERTMAEVVDLNAAKTFDPLVRDLQGDLRNVRFPEIPLGTVRGLARVKCHEAVFPNWPPPTSGTTPPPPTP